MTPEQRLHTIEKSLAALIRKGRGWLLIAEDQAGDNYLEVDPTFQVTANHRRWPACKLPPLSSDSRATFDRLGFLETEHNLVRSYRGWTFPRIAAQLERIFLRAYGCAPDFALRIRLQD